MEKFSSNTAMYMHNHTCTCMRSQKAYDKEVIIYNTIIESLTLWKLLVSRLSYCLIHSNPLNYCKTNDISVWWHLTNDYVEEDEGDKDVERQVEEKSKHNVTTSPQLGWAVWWSHLPRNTINNITNTYACPYNRLSHTHHGVLEDGVPVFSRDYTNH